jgi:hypothetical protein
MRKLYLITSILLLSSVWLVAQTSPSSPGSATQQPSTDQSSPSATSPSQASPTQSTAPDTTQTSTSNSSIEGCLSGSSGNYTLTDTAGKAWQLSGDTSKLTEHVGHQVRITGSEASGSSSGAGAAGSSASAGASGSAGSQSTFTVQKVKMISSSCPTGK